MKPEESSGEKKGSCKNRTRNRAPATSLDRHTVKRLWEEILKVSNNDKIDQSKQVKMDLGGAMQKKEQ